MATIAGISLGIIIFVFVFLAVLMYFTIKCIGCAIAPFMGNIIAGGILYILIDSFHIVKMDWSLFDAVIVAIFGVPGTIFLAIWEAL